MSYLKSWEIMIMKCELIEKLGKKFQVGIGQLKLNIGQYQKYP